jgi:hypothetical protein
MSIKTKQEFLAVLPPLIKTRLVELQQSLERELGDELAALILHGGVVRGGRFDGTEDLHLMIVLREAALEKLARIASALTMARYAIRVEPMLLTSTEVQQAADVFPLLYDDIRHAHVLLAGTDPFSALQIDDRHRRLRIEQELRDAQIRLRRLIIDSLGDPETLGAGLAHKVRQIRSPLLALLKLRKVSGLSENATDGVADVVRTAGKHYGVDITTLLALPAAPDSALPVITRLLAAAVQDVDQIAE